MSEDAPQQPTQSEKGGGRQKKPTRRLSLASRVRGSFRREMDRIFNTDAIWSGLLVVAVLVALGGPWFGMGYEDLQVGQAAPRDIKAYEAFQFPDTEETEKRRREARDAVPAVYGYNTDRGEQVEGQLADIFRQGREALASAQLSDPESSESIRQTFRDRVPEEALGLLIERGFDRELERQLTAALRETMDNRIVANKSALELGGVITLAPVRGTRQEVRRFDSFIDLNQARSLARDAIIARLDLPRDEEQTLGTLAEWFVDQNVYYEHDATTRDRERAAAAQAVVFTEVRRGELLVEAGQRMTQEDIDKIGEARLAAGRPTGPQVWGGLLLIASMLAFFIYRYTRYHQRRFRKFEHLHALMVLMLISMLVLSEAILWVARRMTDNLEAPFNRIEAYPYLIPLGAGAILVALLANGRIATVYSAFCTILFGAANGWNAYLMAWAFLVQCAGVYAISTYRERAALLRAGLVVGGAGAASAVALEALRGGLDPLSHGLYPAVLAFIGGAVGVGLLISFSLPLLESLFGVLTDIRLLELSNINNPLLSEFAVKAPGSYNHSLVVGTLAEEAAKAIGANSLFCRVAAFYHDIGKMNKPEYFVENQRGVNPHDRLSPSMSALIIASHVKDGIKMAREEGLPEQIVDIIPQHHGTKLMTYFYEKAKTQADPSLGPVKEEDFRYPGPKPQTREAAIFMLADAVEAAARTVEEPTPNRLGEMVRKITNSIVVSGELNSCHLTFADLTKIQDAFQRCLVSMYHHRVDYPGFDFRKPKGGGKEPEPPTDIRERRAVRSR